MAGIFLCTRGKLFGMKLQFSLATLLVWITMLSIVLFASTWTPVWRSDPIDYQFTNGVLTKVAYGKPYSHSPRLKDVLWRLGVWGVPAVAITQLVIWRFRRLKSRHENGPPVG
jgi:hypothetical protein